MRKFFLGTDVLSTFYTNKLLLTRKFSILSVTNLGRNQLFRKYIEMNITSNKLYYSSERNGPNVGTITDIFNFENKHSNATSSEEELESLMFKLREILKHRTENISSWIIERKIKTLCRLYKYLSKAHKSIFLQELAGVHAVDHKQVYQAAKILLETDCECTLKLMKTEDQLRNLLTPHYLWLFLHIGKLEKGVKFLVDLRTDVLDLMAEKNSESPVVDLQKLNTTLRELLSMWFSVGFLELERVTWKSPCELLQRISEYEAVHPVRSWLDLKRRVGPYRRCFVFLHRSMPGEPIVVLHTALCDEISCTMKDIVSAQSRMAVEQSKVKETFSDSVEDPRDVKAAVFYSISSTQRGLQGIELGNYLIKCVVGELQIEFPQMTQFSSLSPIPLFRAWLLERLKNAKRGHNDILLNEEVDILQRKFNLDNVFDQLRRLLFTNAWLDDVSLASFLEVPLMRLCARYLYLEKRRGYALDSVANFHLKNGAVMWRLNWKANLLPRGLSNSCGIMVNYRYFLDDTENNSIAYVEKQKIAASVQIAALAADSQKLMATSKL